MNNTYLSIIKNIIKRNSLNYVFLINSDQHNNEYIREDSKVIKKISNFSGSNAKVLISPHKNILFTDSRYYIQAKQQLDSNEWEFRPESELKEYLKTLDNIGVEMSTINVNIKEAYLNSQKLTNVEIRSEIDQSDLAFRSNESLIYLNTSYTGCTIKEKLYLIRKTLKLNESKATCLIITKLDEIAWLLNHRYLNDIPSNPLFFSYITVIFTSKITIQLYINKKQFNIKEISSNIIKELEEGISLEVYDYISFDSDFIRNAKTISNNITFNISKSINYKLFKILTDTINSDELKVNDTNIVENIKSKKNSIEIEGIKKAHIIDGFALLKFNLWLEKQLNSSSNITELQAAEKLYEIRKENEFFQSESFDTISSFDKNSAIVHYKPDSNSIPIRKEGIYLLDSGAHYLFGTTDTTRVFYFGDINRNNSCAFMKLIYTKVLQGNLALERAVLDYNNPNNSVILDSIARQFLKRINKDYGHGTGHGIGCYLNVHEGPISISPNSKHKLEENMIFSNEPGCYMENQFGVRIENNLLSKRVNNNLVFENLTVYPYAKNLLDLALLSSEDVDYINTYHQSIYDKISKLDSSNSELLEYLFDKTKKIE